MFAGFRLDSSPQRPLQVLPKMSAPTALKKVEDAPLATDIPLPVAGRKKIYQESRKSQKPGSDI